MNANLLVHIQFPVHLLYATLNSAYKVLCFSRSAFSQCRAAPSARQSVSCSLVLMRKNLGLKGFLTFWQMHPVNLLLFSFFFLASGLHLQLTVPVHTDWQPNLRPFTQLRKLAFQHLIDILCILWSLFVLLFVSSSYVIFLFLYSSLYVILYFLSFCLQ